MTTEQAGSGYPLAGAPSELSASFVGPAPIEHSTAHLWTRAATTLGDVPSGTTPERTIRKASSRRTDGRHLLQHAVRLTHKVASQKAGGMLLPTQQ